MDYAKSVDVRNARVFFKHHIHRVLPSGKGDAGVQCDLEKLSKTLKKLWICDQGLIVA